VKKSIFLLLGLSTIGFMGLVPVALGQFLDETQVRLPERAIARLGKGRIQEVQYSPDGSRLAVATAIGIWLYDAETGKPIDLLIGHTKGASSIAYSSDGARLASGSDDGTIRVWDAKTGILLHTLTGHTGDISSVSYSTDGKRIASGGGDGTVLLWNLALDTPSQR